MHDRFCKLLAIPFLATVLSAQAPAAGAPELVLSVGHSGRPSHAAFAGGYLATAIWSNLALIDLSTGLTFAHLPHGGHITALEASPAGDVIAVGHCDRAAELWDVKTRRRLQRLAVLRECVDSLSFSPDGALLAITEIGNLPNARCCSPYGSVQIWDVRSGALKSELAKNARIRQVVFGGDGRWLAGVDDKGKTTVFEWPSGRQLRTFGGVAGAGPWESSGLSSPDGKYLAWKGFRGLQVWDVASGTSISNVDAATAAEFLNDGRLAYVEDDRLKVVTLPNGAIEELPLEQPKEVGGYDVFITVSPEWLRIRRDGRTIAGTFESRTVLWDVGAAKLRDLASPALTYANSLQWSRSGILAWRESSNVWAWSDSLGELVEHERNILVGRVEGLSLFDDADRQEKRIVSLEDHWSVAHAAFSLDGKWMAVALASDNLDAVKVWPAAGGGESVTLDADDVNYGPQPPAFSSDSRWLASFSKGTSLMLWSAGSWKLARKWTLPGTGRALMFAPEGSRLAIAAEGEAAIWDSRTSRKLVTLSGPGTSKAWQIAWSPDGRRVVTSSDDGVLRFWNASNGRLLASLYTFADDTRDWLLLTPDGRLDGSERALATVVAWRTGDRVSLDERLTERRRVRQLWGNLSTR